MVQVVVRRTDDHLEHKKNFKYIKKKKVNGKWRYYYDIKDALGFDEADEYNTAKSNNKKTKTALSDSKIERTMQKDIAKLDGKIDAREHQKIKKYSKNVEENTKVRKKAEKAYKKAKEKFKKTPVGFLKLTMPETIEKGKKLVKKALNIKDEVDTSKKKVKLPNGKTHGFDDTNEYTSYLKRIVHQQSEPKFMKDVPKISKNKVYTAKEDMDKVNETFSPYDDSTSTNCANCSAAYELRRRGYDVEAKANGGSDEYNGRADRYYDYYENAEVLNVYEDGSTFVQNKKFARKACGKGYSILDSLIYKEDHKYSKSTQNYTVSSIEKAILDNNPPGSRGMIDVKWNEGSGHSIVYEVDNKGKIMIRDAQTYDEYSLDELASKVKRVRITRTDNLRLKEGILNAVVPNKDKKRQARVDKDGLVWVRQR